MVGHANYVDQIIRTMQVYITENRALFQGSMMSIINGDLKQLEAAPETTFLNYMWGESFSAVFFAVIFGLFIAGILSRPSKPFGEDITNK